MIRQETSENICSALQFCQKNSNQIDFKSDQSQEPLRDFDLASTNSRQSINTLPYPQLFGITAHCFECKHLITKVEHDVGNDKSEVIIIFCTCHIILQAIIFNFPSQAHIKAVLNQTCTSAPSQLREECFEFVQTHEDYIIKSIQNEATPKEICHGLGFCEQHSSDVHIEQFPDSKHNGKYQFEFSDEEIRSLELVEAELAMKHLDETFPQDDAFDSK